MKPFDLGIEQILTHKLTLCYISVPQDIYKAMSLNFIWPWNFAGGTGKRIQCKAPAVQEFLELVKSTYAGTTHISTCVTSISTRMQSISTEHEAKCMYEWVIIPWCCQLVVHVRLYHVSSQASHRVWLELSCTGRFAVGLSVGFGAGRHSTVPKLYLVTWAT